MQLLLGIVWGEVFLIYRLRGYGFMEMVKLVFD